MDVMMDNGGDEFFPESSQQATSYADNNSHSLRRTSGEGSPLAENPRSEELCSAGC